MTLQRKVILDALRSVKTHPTADELYAMVRRELPNVSLGTVYRNLETMSEMGVIQKLSNGEGKMRFDGNTAPHHHVCCTVCGRLDDMPVEAVGSVMSLFPGAGAHGITGYDIEFKWICPRCRESGVGEPHDQTFEAWFEDAEKAVGDIG